MRTVWALTGADDTKTQVLTKAGGSCSRGAQCTPDSRPLTRDFPLPVNNTALANEALAH